MYVRRGNQPCYSYTEFPRVKAAKVERVVKEVMYQILAHETRSGMSGNATPIGSGYVGHVGGNTFIVRRV